MRFHHTFAVVVLGTTLVACSPRVDVATPRLETITLQAHSTRDTASLLIQTGRNYTASNRNITLLTQIQEQNAWENTTTPYQGIFITHHYVATQELRALPIARDALVVLTHASNPINQLSLNELRGIYQGTITTWAQLGGDDIAIQPVTRITRTSIQQEFSRLVMGQRRITPNAITVNSSAQAYEILARTPAGIAFVTYSFLNNQDTAQTDSNVIITPIEDLLPTTNTIQENRYPLPITVYVVSLNELHEHYRAFIDWLQQNLIENVDYGFLPIVNPP